MNDSKVRAAILNDIREDSLKRKNIEFEFGPLGKETSVIFCRSAKIMCPLPTSLQAICRAGSGTDNIPLQECRIQGIPVFTSPGANARSVAEFAIMAMIGASRNAFYAADWLHSIEMGYALSKEQIEDQKAKLAGNEITGSSILILGMGPVGRDLASLCKKFDMRIYAYDPFVDQECFKDAVRLDNLEHLPPCRFISLHLALTEGTRGMIKGSFFGRLQFDPAILINMARGELVNTKDVEAAIISKKLASYTSDFYDPYLVGEFEKGIVTFFPHLGASTEQAQTRATTMVADSFAKFWTTGEIDKGTSVNFPACHLDSHENTFRLAVSNDNVPGRIEEVSHVIAAAKLNVAAMINESRDDVGYSLVDIAQPKGGVNESGLLEKILTIEGIKRARIITLT